MVVTDCELGVVWRLILARGVAIAPPRALCMKGETW
nr:MAG TPA: hypothetical protein [Caudoviricetes sp.]